LERNGPIDAHLVTWVGRLTGGTSYVIRSWIDKQG
jgi:hypothetical protein